MILEHKCDECGDLEGCRPMFILCGWGEEVERTFCSCDCLIAYVKKMEEEK